MFKLCLIGAGGVGKTCIVKRLCFDTFTLNTQLTVGIDFYTYDLPIIIDGKETNVRLSIWDFGGQERFKMLFPYYITGTSGIFLVFDLIQIQSLLSLDWWFDRLVENNVEDRPRILIGSKFDLVKQEDNKFGIDESIINASLERFSVNDFIKTSSKDGVNIRDIFKQMVKKLLDFHELDYEKIV